MLQHLFTSCRKMHLHLIAYSAATSTPQQVTENDVPDYEYYEFEQDRAMTDEMLRMSKELLEHLEQHRSTYYPDQPATPAAIRSTEQVAVSDLRTKARLQLHNAHQKLATAQHHLGVCETLATSCTAPGIVPLATIRRFRLREYGLTERVMRHYVRYNSTNAQ